MRGPALLWVDTPHHLRPICNGLHQTALRERQFTSAWWSACEMCRHAAGADLLAVECAILAGETLADDFGRFVHEYCWLMGLWRVTAHHLSVLK